MKLFLIISIYFLSSFKAYAIGGINDGAALTNTAQQSFASDFPLPLVYNKKNNYKWSVAAGILLGEVDGNEINSIGELTNVNGTTDGAGISLGYANSFRDKWALFTYFQASMVSANVT
jgi:hypothetical protein